MGRSAPTSGQNIGIRAKIESNLLNPIMQAEEPDRGFEKCGYSNLVLADTVNTDIEKNDFKGFFYKVEKAGDSLDLELEKFNGTWSSVSDLNDSSMGEFWALGDFEDYPLYTAYKLQWRNVLSAHGEGQYRVKASGNILGESVEYISNSYNLKTYSTSLADKTVRIDSIMDGYLEFPDIDFTGLEWEDSIRVPGFFGRRQATYDETFVPLTDQTDQQVRDNQTNEYTFQSNLVPCCITEEILDYHMFADELFISDYNANNHCYKYLNFPVKKSTVEDTAYNVFDRGARLTITFNNRKGNRRKRHC